MTQTVENLLVYFEKLTESEKHDLAIEVVRRTDIFGAPELSDNELALAADDLFLVLDREETKAFVGMWRNREDMSDSSAWVRNKRETHWGK